jgi:hypothetical protein
MLASLAIYDGCYRRKAKANMRTKVWHWMKRIWRVLGRLALAGIFLSGVMAQDAPSAFAQQAAATTMKLERGQELALLMHTTIDSESSKVGDRVEFQLARAVMSGNQIVLPAGWVVTAHVTKVRPAGKSNCKRGAVDWKMDPMTAPDGTKVELVSLRGRYNQMGDPDKVHFTTTNEKIEKVAEAPFVAIVFLLMLPAELIMAVGEASDLAPCGSRPGAPDIVPARTTQYAAVAHDVNINVLSRSTAN